MTGPDEETVHGSTMSAAEPSHATAKATEGAEGEPEAEGTPRAGEVREEPGPGAVHDGHVSYLAP
ncbi:hypothetical protein [Cellulomonas endophytica]|uniref:hypothetical protein n=1 Tax=Cellulomonas endophytica TaxID=2494735 RepID=UPI0010113756|nr:hypothetical protein [Cellulomonas endophytica]